MVVSWCWWYSRRVAALRLLPPASTGSGVLLVLGRGVNSAQGARATWGLTTDAGAEAQPKDNQTRTSSALIFAG